jgi:hypothetical protein
MKNSLVKQILGVTMCIDSTGVDWIYFITCLHDLRRSINFDKQFNKDNHPTIVITRVFESLDIRNDLV